MSQVTTTKCNAKFTTLIYIVYWYIWWLGFCRQHVNIREHNYKALHQCYIKITCRGTKVSNAVLVCFYNTRRDSSVVSGRVCRQQQPVNDSKQTSPRGQNHRRVWVSRPCPKLSRFKRCSSGTERRWTPDTGTISIVTQILQIYSYMVMYIPPMCTRFDHYCWQDQSLPVVTRRPHGWHMQEGLK